MKKESKLENPVWKRQQMGNHDMDLQSFITAVTMFTIYGLLLASFLAYLTMGWNPGLVVVLVVGLVIPFLGITISIRSDDWLISFVGYTMVVGGLGLIIGPSIAMYDIRIVINALIATGGVTIACSIVGIIYPKSLSHWGIYLFAGLSALICVRFAQVILGTVYPDQSWYWPIVEYAGALLFSLYIIYDWNRAVRLDRTLDNAVDSAVALFLDIVNLFLHLLRIMAKK